MAHSTKYRVHFSDRLHNDYVIDLKKKDYTGDVNVLLGSGSPLVYEMPSVKLFDPIKGFGGIIEVIAQSDRELLDLYTVDYREWVVEIYKNDVLDFTGYGEAELYEQPLKQAIAYPVSITIHNGFSVLKRERYIDSSGDKYRGLTNIFEVLKICLEKILTDLPQLDTLRVSQTIKVNDTYGDEETSSGNDGHCILESLVINNDNFIDEDWESMNCYEVLESILSVQGYSIFIHKNIVYIVHSHSLRNNSVWFYEYDISNGQISSGASEELIDGFNKDISDLVTSDASFVIEAGYNVLKLTKNRYVKQVIEEVDFNDDENYDGDPEDNVWDYGNLLPLIEEQIDWVNSDDSLLADDSYWKGFLEGEYWFTNSVGGSSYDYFRYFVNEDVVDHINRPTYLTCTDNDHIAFAGGIKSKEYVDDQEISYTQDGNEFEHYIFVNNAFYDLATCAEMYNEPPAEGGGYELPPPTMPYDDVKYDAFEYTEEPPYIFPSNKVMLRLHFTIRFLSPSMYRVYWQSDDQEWEAADAKASELDGYREEDLKNDYGRFGVPVTIKLLDQDGDVYRYLKFGDFTPDTDRTNVPYREDRFYEWEDPGDGSVYSTVIPVENFDELENEVNILNEDFSTYVDIPVNFDIIGKVTFTFHNTVYKLKDEGNGHLQRQNTFMEDFPHIGFKNIYTEVIDKATGKAIELKDEELQFYLSENYKTESENIELTTLTADNRYILDVSGVMKSDTYENKVIDYIDSVNIESEYDSFEKALGNLYVGNYQYNKVHLNVQFQEDSLYPIHTFEWSWDQKWQNVLYTIIKYNNDVRYNVIDITLENFYSL